MNKPPPARRSAGANGVALGYALNNFRAIIPNGPLGVSSFKRAVLPGAPQHRSHIAGEIGMRLIPGGIASGIPCRRLDIDPDAGDKRFQVINGDGRVVFFNEGQISPVFLVENAPRK